MGSGRLYASVPISGSVWLRTKRMARDLKGVDLRSGAKPTSRSKGTTLSARIHPTRNPVVDKQRERIFEAWRN